MICELLNRLQTATLAFMFELLTASFSLVVDQQCTLNSEVILACKSYWCIQSELQI